MTPAPDPRFRLVRSLEAFAREHPLRRKLVVARTFGEGSELLRALTLHTGGWVGFEVTTPARLAAELAGANLAGGGKRLLDEFEQTAVVDEALDRVFSAGDWGRLRVLEEGEGFRDAVAGAVSALRLAGVSRADLAAAGFSDVRRRAFLEAVLGEYEGHLTEHGRADTADVLRWACSGVSKGAHALAGAAVALVPGLSTRGLVGALVAALLEVGARVLETDALSGPAPPEDYLWASKAGSPFWGLLGAGIALEPAQAKRLELFAAASVTSEIRQVLRIVMERGLSWDAVEIVTPDPATYGTVLHAISRRLSIPVSFGVGLPVERTRPGRAIHTYLRWIEDGFPSQLLRGLFESGDLLAPSRHGGVSPAALARRLRRLRVGWGRKRYAAAIESARRTLEAETDPWPDETPEDAAARAERQRQELDALEAVIRRLERFTPSGIREGSNEAISVSPSELARGVRAFLEMVREGEGADAIARRDLLQRLGRIIETLRRPTGLAAALATLRRHLKIRVRAAWDEGSPPWKSTGGHVHLTDLAHGGLTGRRLTFVVGLDAGRFPGPGFQDPVLLDGDRRSLDPPLPTSGEGLLRRRFELAALMARVRGELVLSYTAWDPAEGRVLQPSPVMLQAYRAKMGSADATYADLRQALGVPCGVIPRSGEPVDGSDVWMAAMDERDGLRNAERSLREAFSDLDAGLRADEARALDQASSYYGVLELQADALDPRKREGAVVSASLLEALGACPLRYFYRFVLGLRPPDDATLDPDHWLDRMQRGSLLHRVFERALREARERGVEDSDPAFERLALDVLDAEANAMVGRVPAPSRAVKGREVAEMREDVRSFVDILRRNGADWVQLELTFGRGAAPPVELPVRGGSLAFSGAIDRVDRVECGLRVVDYKTGITHGFQPTSGVFHGGRRLQHAVYAAVAEQILGEEVCVAEYHFPTPRGENTIHAFDRAELESGLDLVGALLDQVAEGRFLPTDDPGDCKVCDYREVCRVDVDGREITSPMADWGRRNRELLPAYALLKRVRDWDVNA